VSYSTAKALYEDTERECGRVIAAGLQHKDVVAALLHNKRELAMYISELESSIEHLAYHGELNTCSLQYEPDLPDEILIHRYIQQVSELRQFIN